MSDDESNAIASMSRAELLFSRMWEVDIDVIGIFPYILVRLYSTEKGDNAEMTIVRAFEWADSHAELYGRLVSDIRQVGILKCQLIGGGLIRRDPRFRTIHVYDAPSGVPKTNHKVAGEKLQKRYKRYKVTWQSE